MPLAGHPRVPDGLCFFHANPDSAKALGQIGGRKNRRSAVDLQVPDNMTAADLRKVTGQAIRLLLSGELQAREASALAQLCNSLYRVIPTADLEARVTMLEEQVAQEESGTLSDLDSTTVTPTHGTETSETDAALVAEQQEPSSIDTTNICSDTLRRRSREHERWIRRSRGGIAASGREEAANFAVSVA